MNDWDFLRRVLIVAGVVIAILCLWQLSHAFLLFFGAMLFAILLGGAADPFVRHLSMSRPVALGIVVFLILLVVGSFAALYGAQIIAQTNDLAQRLPAAIKAIEQRFGLGDISARLIEQAKSHSGSILFQITTLAGIALNALSDLFLLLIDRKSVV